MSLALLVHSAAAAGGHEGNVQLQTVIFGFVALCVFGTLALITFSYRDVANRHSAKADAYARNQIEGGHDAGQGH